MRMHFKHFAKMLRRKINLAYRQAENRKIRCLSNSFRNDAMKFWQKVKALKKDSNNIEVPMDELKKTFTETFTTKLIESDDSQAKANVEAKANRIKMTPNTYTIESTDVANIIKRLNIGKLKGYHKVSNECFKYGGIEITKAVTAFLNVFMNERMLPTDFNIALLYPIIKNNKGSYEDVNNVRPIQVSDTFNTIFDNIIFNELNKSFDESPMQFGFRANYNCSHAAFCLNELLIHHKKLNRAIYLCYLDFTKAFDKINRHILLDRLDKDSDLNDDLWYMLKNILRSITHNYSIIQ